MKILVIDEGEAWTSVGSRWRKESSSVEVGAVGSRWRKESSNVEVGADDVHPLPSRLQEYRCRVATAVKAQDARAW